jgi:succinate dehydrogenase / fumarate reductase membrane anchor subunit
MKSQDMRTPLGRVLGYGSAKWGTKHFIEQRLTGLANIPLTIAAVLIVTSLIGHNHAAVVQILGSTPVAIIMLLFIISGAYHMRLGMQVIIEDYVHDEVVRSLRRCPPMDQQRSPRSTDGPTRSRTIPTM